MASTKLGVFDARRWIGGMADDEPTTVNVSTPVAPADVALMERPVQVAPAPYVPTKYRPVPADLKAYTAEQLAEYSEVARAVGVAPPDLVVEQFKTYLLGSGMTVFSLQTVVAFMDKKAMDEGTGWGWNWVPLRAKDAVQMVFGRRAERPDSSWSRMSTFGAREDWEEVRRIEEARRVRACDFFGPENGVYSKVVPLHALKKVAQIEREFGHPVHFAITDYATAPAFRPDPFLMAFVPNANVARGDGRFIIDVWDEPGFGIDQMLKSDLA